MQIHIALRKPVQLLPPSASPRTQLHQPPFAPQSPHHAQNDAAQARVLSTTASYTPYGCLQLPMSHFRAQHCSSSPQQCKGRARRCRASDTNKACHKAKAPNEYPSYQLGHPKPQRENALRCSAAPDTVSACSTKMQLFKLDRGQETSAAASWPGQDAQRSRCVSCMMRPARRSVLSRPASPVLVFS